MPNISFNRFDAGFVSEYDINRLLAPDGACKNIANFEINAPDYALKESTGSSVFYALPSYSGSRIVAHKNWKVAIPSSEEITVLVTSSNNMLLYSEDFEVSSAWTFTADGATLTPNDVVSPQGVRKGDTLTDIGDTTSLAQFFGGVSNYEFYLLTIYFKKTTANRIRLSITDGTTTVSNSSIDDSGNWTRLQLEYMVTKPGIQTVIIDFPDSTGSDECSIWGIQLERETGAGGTATGYGATYHYARPYYILQRPYWNGSSWIDDWLNLTEMRAGIISSSADGTFTITNMDGVNGAFNNWYAWDITTSSPTGYITSYTEGGLYNIVGKKIADDGAVVIVSRFSFFAEIPYYKYGDIVESNITFVEVEDSLKISFGNTHRPLTLKYIDSDILAIPGDSEYLIPISDEATGDWVPAGSVPPSTLWEQMTVYAEDKYPWVPSTYGAKGLPISGVGDYCEIGLDGTSETPTVAQIAYRVTWESYSGDGNLQVDLYCGATLIHTEPLIYESGSGGNFISKLTPTEVAAITAIGGGWSDLRLRFTANTTAGVVLFIVQWAFVIISGYGDSEGSLVNQGFTLSYSSHIGVQPPSVNNPVLPDATLVESEGVGKVTAITLSADTSGSLATDTYKVYVVGVIDGNQRIPIFTDDVAVTGPTGSINVTIPIQAAGFDWRLTALEIYVGTGAVIIGSTYDYNLYDTILMENIVGGAFSTSASDNNWTIVVSILDIDTTQPTLLYNLGGCLDIIETRARYNIAFYLLGRMFISQTDEGGRNIIRYSNIANLTSEVDKFAYSSGGYGFFTFDSTMNQRVMNICRTIENDLLIVQENDVSLFEVQSGNASAKRLRQMFNGIGSSNIRSLVISDYGNFWYDNHDVYWYRGGYELPRKISKGKIRHYWRQVLMSYIATSFAIFNREVNEYWIFIYNGASWVVLRYSPEYDNWNIWKPGYTPIWLSEKLDGSVTTAMATNIYEYGGTAVTSAPYITTHARKLAEHAIAPKQIEEAYISRYSAASNITMDIYIDEETSPRDGNSPVFISTRKTWRRAIRHGSSMNYITLKLSTAALSGAEIDEFGIVVQGRKDRTSDRK